MSPEAKRCYALVNRCLDAVLPFVKPDTTEAVVASMLGATMRTIREGGNVADLERACPAVFGQPAQPAGLPVGAVVRLKSGGPNMVIGAVAGERWYNKDDSATHIVPEGRCLCLYFDGSYNRQWVVVALDCLTAV
jgi:uncharacterized protein YodC (DUF2158 family)